VRPLIKGGISGLLHHRLLTSLLHPGKTVKVCHKLPWANAATCVYGTAATRSPRRGGRVGRRHGNSERLRRLHANCQLVLGWCLDRKIQPQNSTGTAPPSTRAIGRKNGRHGCPSRPA